MSEDSDHCSTGFADVEVLLTLVVMGGIIVVLLVCTFSRCALRMVRKAHLGSGYAYLPDTAETVVSDELICVSPSGSFSYPPRRGDVWRCEAATLEEEDATRVRMRLVRDRWIH